MPAPAPYDITQPSAKVFISTSLSWRNQVAFVGRRQRENGFISPDARPICPRVRNDLDPPQDLFFRIRGGAHQIWGIGRFPAVPDQTVGNILRRHGRSPAPKRRQAISWKDFIRSHMEVLVGTDFFTGKVRSLRRALQQYVVHYHEERNHQGKENLILFPLKAEGARNRQTAVRCRERLGGLLKYYEREAA